LHPGNATESDFELQENDIVLVMSDGITDQYVPAHYRKLESSHWEYDLAEQERLANERLAAVVAKHPNPVDAIREIGSFTWKEMEEEGKPDNRCLVLYVHEKG
jgi:hypothetical protein